MGECPRLAGMTTSEKAQVVLPGLAIWALMLWGVYTVLKRIYRFFFPKGVYTVLKRNFRFFFPAQSYGKGIYPMSTEGTMSTVQKIMNVKAPDFVMDQAQKLNAWVLFRLNIPEQFRKGGAWVVSDAKLARQILTHPKTEKTKLHTKMAVICGDVNIFSGLSDAHWKMVRKGTSPAFSQREVTRMVEVAQKHVQRWINETLEPLVEAKKSFDVNTEMILLTCRVICEAAFEYDVSDEEVHSFTHNFEVAGEELMIKPAQKPLRELFRHFNPKHYTALQACKELHEFGHRVLQAYRNKKDKSEAKTVIHLLESLDLTEKQKVAEIVLFIFAGHDTTSYTLGNAFYHLAKHPKWSTALREELCSLGENKAKSPLLQYIIHENNRLLPVSSLGVLRKCHEQIEVRRDGVDVTIPAGAYYLLSNILIHNNPKVFDKPEVFNPLRWKDATEEMESSLLTFTAGPRNCLGQPLAIAEIHAVLTQLVKDYVFEIADEGEHIYYLTTRMQGCMLLPRRADEPTKINDTIGATAPGVASIKKP